MKLCWLVYRIHNILLIQRRQRIVVRYLILYVVWIPMFNGRTVVNLFHSGVVGWTCRWLWDLWIGFVLSWYRLLGWFLTFKDMLSLERILGVLVMLAIWWSFVMDFLLILLHTFIWLVFSISKRYLRWGLATQCRLLLVFRLLNKSLRVLSSQLTSINLYLPLPILVIFWRQTIQLIWGDLMIYSWINPLADLSLSYLEQRLLSWIFFITSKFLID